MTEAEWNASSDPSRMLAWLAPMPPVTDGLVTHWSGNRRISDRKLRLFACGCCRLVWDKLTDPRSRRAVEVGEAFADGLATEAERYCAHPALPGATAAVFADARTAAIGTMKAWALLNVPPPAAHADLLRSIVGNPFRPVTLRWVVRDAGSMSTAALESGAMEEEQQVRWLTPNVLALAQACYGGEACPECGGDGIDETDTGGNVWQRPCGNCAGSGRTPFDAAALPILADALEEAGCTDERILRHLRGDDPCDCERGWRRAGGIDEFGDYFVTCCHHDCSGTGWHKAAQPRVRGDWVIDTILGKE